MKDLSSLRLADLWREVKTTEEDIWGDIKLETKWYEPQNLYTHLP